MGPVSSLHAMATAAQERARGRGGRGGVRGRLDRPVASVDHRKLDQVAPGVELNARLSDDDLPRLAGDLLLAEDGEVGHGEERTIEGEGKVSILRRDRRVHRKQLRAVRERGLNLNLGHERRDAGKHLTRPEQLLPAGHQCGHRCAVADHLHHLGGDQSDRLRRIQLHTAGETPLCELASRCQAHVVELARGEVHAAASDADADRSADRAVERPRRRKQHCGGEVSCEGYSCA